MKNVYGSGKSYTCLLQQQMYRDRGYAPDAFADETAYEYVTKMRLEEPEKYLPAKASAEYPALDQIIAQDAKLKYIYDSDVLELDVQTDPISDAPQYGKAAYEKAYAAGRMRLSGEQRIVPDAVVRRSRDLR